MKKWKFLSRFSVYPSHWAFKFHLHFDSCNRWDTHKPQKCTIVICWDGKETIAKCYVLVLNASSNRYSSRYSKPKRKIMNYKLITHCIIVLVLDKCRWSCLEAYYAFFLIIFALTLLVIFSCFFMHSPWIHKVHKHFRKRRTIRETQIWNQVQFINAHDLEFQVTNHFLVY